MIIYFMQAEYKTKKKMRQKIKNKLLRKLIN